VAVAVLSSTFFFMMYMCNSFSLAWVRRTFAVHPARPSSAGSPGWFAPRGPGTSGARESKRTGA
ncbi:MAG: hypothetical protein ACM3WT_07535, partial [Bacillota bacterium]